MSKTIETIETIQTIEANKPGFLPAERLASYRADQDSRQILVDLTALVKNDDKSGIQRVVRSVLKALFDAPPQGCRIEPVFDAGGYYAYARKFTFGDALAARHHLEDEPIKVKPDDWFFGLDLCPSEIPENLALLQDLRRHDVKIYFAVYDLLPVNQPEMFYPGAQPWFGRWLEAIASVADGLVCISRAVADDLLTWLDKAQVKRSGSLQVGYFHLGADIAASKPSFGITGEEQAILAEVAARPSFLMVGTLEPRKRHGQALAAFEALWATGLEVNLVLVGKSGWMQDELFAALRAHPENGKRLFWLERASDQMLGELYARAVALLNTSSGEGFGLPLIEAAQHKLPIIARDLAVFREVSAEHAYYFDGDGPAALADAVTAWLDLHSRGEVPRSEGIQSLTWAESTRQLLDVLERQEWYQLAPTQLA